MSTLFLFAFLACGLANFVFSIIVLRTINRAGIQVGFYEIRWQVHKHLKTYKQVTTDASGRIGPAYYGYWGSLYGMVLSGGLLVLSLTRNG